MEKKRSLINTGFALFPIVIAIMYFAMIVASGSAANAIDPTNLGLRVFSVFLTMPNVQGANIIDDVTTIFQICSIIVIIYSTFLFMNRKTEAEKNAAYGQLILALFIFLGISLTPLIESTLFMAISIIEQTLATNLYSFFELLRGQPLFIFSFAALTFVRYFILYLLTILIPAALFFCIFSRTRAIGKLMIEQIILWSFSASIVLITFFLMEKFLEILWNSLAVSPAILSVPATIAVIISPMIMLELIEATESALSDLTPSEIKSSYVSA